MFLVIIDAHSKWMEVEPTTYSSEIESYISGIPYTMVTDNGPCFASKEFDDFMKRNGVTHITTAPVPPLVKRACKACSSNVTEGLRKMKHGTLEDKITRFLFQYRLPPQTTTGVSPGKLMMGRRL